MEAARSSYMYCTMQPCATPRKTLFFTVIAVEGSFSQGTKCPVYKLTFSVCLLIFVYFKKSSSPLATWIKYVFYLWLQFLANNWCFDKYLAYCAQKGVQVSMLSICCCCCQILNRVQQQQHMLVKLANIEFHGNALSGSWIVPRRKAEGNMARLVGVLFSFLPFFISNVSKIVICQTDFA